MGHFFIVFAALLLVFSGSGHFLFAYAYPDEFGTLQLSFIATFKLLSGSISIQNLKDACE